MLGLCSISRHPYFITADKFFTAIISVIPSANNILYVTKGTSTYIREEEKEFLFQGNLVLRVFNNLAHYIVNQLNDSVASVRDL